MADKNIDRSHLLAIHAYEKDLARANKWIIHWTAERNEALMMIRRLMGEAAPTKTTRPWQLVRDRLKLINKTLSWQDTYLACAILEQVAMKFTPEEDMRRMVSLAKELKAVNNRVGLAEWPDEKFQETENEEDFLLSE
jgi:hypothetical protein